MPTSRYGMGGLVIPIGLAVVFGVILVGGPTNALEAINDIARGVLYEAMRMVSEWL